MSNAQAPASFQNAAAYLSSSSSLGGVSSSTKLELYGLFKYVTSSPTPSTSRPSIFDMTGRAKWDAWAAAGKAYGDHGTAEVQQRYLDIAKKLGWTESTPIQTIQASEESAISNGDSIWDSEAESSSSRGGGGLGVSVSIMAPPPETNDNSIHGLVLGNDISGLTTLLKDHPDTNIDAVDEFGYAPIHLACDRGNVEVVKLLLEHGANQEVKDPDNLSPLELSQEAGHTEIEELLKTS